MADQPLQTQPAETPATEDQQQQELTPEQISEQAVNGVPDPEQAAAQEGQEGAEGTAATDEPQEEKKPGIMIPKYRFDAVRAREKKLIEEMDQMKQQLEQQGATSREADAVAQQVAATAATDEDMAATIQKLSQEHAAAIFEGETEKAARLQAELLTTVTKAAQQQPTTPEFSKDDVVTEALNRFEVNRIVEQLEDTYPQLDKDSDQFDPDLSQEIAEIYEGLTLRGEPPASALGRAADMVLAAKGITKIEEMANSRGLADKVAAAQTPESMSSSVGTTTNDSAINPEELSSDDWNALPESARNKLLGI